VPQRLDSTQQTDFVPLFTAGGTPLSAELPPRFGYYIGYLVAADLGRKRTLRQLATLNQRQARLLVEHSLQRMATC